MEFFSILALNRPLRWLGSDTWEALFNSFGLNTVSGTSVVQPRRAAAAKSTVACAHFFSIFD